MNDSIAETYEHAGLTVEIHYDQFGGDHANPREWDNLGIMVCSHRRYKLGDEQMRAAFDTEVECEACETTGEVEGRECKRCGGCGYEDLSLDAYMRRVRKALTWLPLSLLDHSGISMYVGSGAHACDPGGWDSGMVGVIYTTAERCDYLGVEDRSEDNLKRMLRDEVETYDLYLTGQVYGYIIRRPDGEDLPDDLMDSVWGFLGDKEVKGEANATAENIAAELVRRAETEAREAAWAAQYGIPTEV